MTTTLPPIPKFVFTVLEPLSLVAGFMSPFIDADWFINEQIANSHLEDISDNARVVAYQLGNIYLLLAMVGIALLYTTTEPKVVRNYLIALWIADLGHVAVTYQGLGYSNFVDVGGWNTMTWGNIGATLFLFAVRSVYLLGGFGPDQCLSPAKEKKTR
ncbi:hypothetical protein B7494_g8182 [Chlorociboria aeruginascens]|nr:hypothetical protein B7494_g8182 [Chlorociboria aeruginascens]